MFSSVTKAYNAARKKLANDKFIVEAVVDVDEVLPGSDEEIDDQIDTDSVPDEAYRKIDAELDKLVSNPDYDDTEVEELSDDDEFDENEVSDAELDAIVDEACTQYWHDWDN